MKLQFTLLLLLTVLGVNAQQQASVTQQSYTDSEGNLYWNKDKPVYLKISETPDGEGQLLKSKKSAKYTNPLYLDTEGINYIRTRYAVDPETKKTISPAQEVLWEIYADGTAPKNTLSFDGAKRYRKGNNTYFGKSLSASISSDDVLSGVANTYYSINGGAYSVYNQNVSFNKSGDFTIKYYSTDKVGNQATLKEERFIVDVDAPETIYNFNGIADGNIIGTSTKIYLTREDSSSGIARTYYKFDEEEFKTYQGRDIPFSYLEDGEHTIYFYSVDNVGNKEATGSFEFYFDKSAPIVAADVLGDRFIANDQIYFSGRTKLKLTAVDNKSGVKDVLYSVDSDEFNSYEDPFYLPSVSGVHVIKYYSLDNMSNQSEGQRSARYEEFKHNVSKVYVDLTGPSLSYEYVGKSFTTRDTVFIAPSTKIKLKGSDAESGLQYISYSVDGLIEETKYAEPFTVDKTGLHNVEIFGYDNVNNRNIQKFSLVVDSTPPAIIVNYSSAPTAVKEGLNVYPSFVIVFLAATDKEIGADKIYYKTNDASRKLYTGLIQNFKKGQRYDIEITTSDKLGNETTETISFYTEE